MAISLLVRDLTMVSLFFLQVPVGGRKNSCCMLALSWFKVHFLKCSERAALVKTWLPAQYDGPKSFLDQLVYDRALVLVSRYIQMVSIFGLSLFF